jgi:predicted nucleic acid-binding protein
MPERLLIDTDVLIDYLRANADAVSYLENLHEVPLISVITVAERHAGVREGSERTALSDFIEAFEIAPLTKEIASAGGLYRRDFGASHGVGLNDALIAATAHVNSAALVTLNRKHFPMLASVTVPYQKG